MSELITKIQELPRKNPVLISTIKGEIRDFLHLKKGDELIWQKKVRNGVNIVEIVKK